MNPLLEKTARRIAAVMEATSEDMISLTPDELVELVTIQDAVSPNAACEVEMAAEILSIMAAAATANEEQP